MTLYYSGIGSRNTPSDVLELMSKAALAFHNKGYVLVSGGAKGADSAFAKPLLNIPGSHIIYRADDATEKAIIEASYHHPAWDHCTSYTKKLHGRNVMIITNHPIKFVLCWTQGGLPVGGTGLGIRIANYYKIPVYNLFNKEVRDRIQKMIDENNQAIEHKQTEV